MLIYEIPIMKKFLKPSEERYFITKDGRVFYGTFSSAKEILREYIDGELKVMIDGIFVNVTELMMITWIGKINLPIFSANPLNPTSRNTKYIIPKVNHLLQDEIVKISNKDFKRICGFSRYFISNCGIVFDSKKNKFISHTLNEDNYHVVKIYNDNYICKTVTIHRLVYKTFVGDIPDGYEIDHLISKSINDVTHLEMISKMENLKRARKNGCYGDHTEHEVRKICKLLSLGYHAYEIAEMDGISTTTPGYRTYISYIHKILYKSMWRDISDEYDFSNYYKRKF